MPDSEQYGILVHCFERSRSRKICIHVQEYKGSTFLSIREFFLSKDTNDWLPTQRGVTVPPDLYTELLHGVEAAAEVLGIDSEAM